MSELQASANVGFDFEALYRRTADPWNFGASPYERDRYARTLAALSRERYGAAFEPGCSVGVLTAQLALRCDALLATDVAPTAVAQARRRCAGLSNVELRCEALDEHLPPRRFDLVVFSEIGYYFGPERLLRLIRALPSRLGPGGEFVAVHWLGHSPDHALHGDDVHALLLANLELRHRHAERRAGFRLDTWVNR